MLTVRSRYGEIALFFHRLVQAFMISIHMRYPRTLIRVKEPLVENISTKRKNFNNYFKYSNLVIFFTKVASLVA